jgi:hypothetical protein
MASSVFIQLGDYTFPGNINIGGNLTVTGTITPTGQILAANGVVGTPSISFASATTSGVYWDGSAFNISIAGNRKFLVNSGGASVAGATDSIGFGGNASLFGESANTLALKNGINGQIFRTYGYTSGSRLARGSIHAIPVSLTLSGATTTATGAIPAGVFLIGVATTTTTTITGATGYTAGDGTTANRWGTVVGTAVGTHTDNSTVGTNPTGWFSAAGDVVLTATGSNFTGGVVQVIVYYLTTTAA